MPRLEYVIEEENVKADADGKKALIQLAEGDMRCAIGKLIAGKLIAANCVNLVNHCLCFDLV